MQIYDFTVPELNKFKELCNFTEDELQYFELRAKKKQNVEISFAMHISDSQVSKLSKRVRSKIIRVLPYM